MACCGVWFARCVGKFYLVCLPVGNCCSCFGLLPFSYVYRGGAVSFLVSKGTCYLFLLIVCGALPFWKKFLIIQKKYWHNIY